MSEAAQSLALYDFQARLKLKLDDEKDEEMNLTERNHSVGVDYLRSLWEFGCDVLWKFLYVVVDYWARVLAIAFAVRKLEKEDSSERLISSVVKLKSKRHSDIIF